MESVLTRLRSQHLARSVDADTVSRKLPKLDDRY